MRESDVTQVNFVPNSVMNIHNHTGTTQKYKLEFGEYGSVEFEVIAGGEVTINNGTKPCTINLLEPLHQPGIKN